MFDPVFGSEMKSFHSHNRMNRVFPVCEVPPRPESPQGLRTTVSTLGREELNCLGVMHFLMCFLITYCVPGE